MRMTWSQKFEELVVYLCQRCDMEKWWGRTKLAKMLYYCDFDAYRDLGSSITGAKYVRMPQGPVAEQLFPALRGLANVRIVEIQRPIGDFDELRPTAIDDPDLSVFSPQEIALVDQVVDRLKSKTARQLSAMAHREEGWRLAGPGEEIPYFTALGHIKRPTRAEAEYYEMVVGSP